jgi:hypothetical protein
VVCELEVEQVTPVPDMVDVLPMPMVTKAGHGFHEFGSSHESYDLNNVVTIIINRLSRTQSSHRNTMVSLERSLERLKIVRRLQLFQNE